MRRSREPLYFVVAFVALSGVLGWVFWNATASLGSYTLSRSMLAVPVASAMIASRGFSLRRKVTYVLITLGAYALAGVLAEVTGVHEAAAEQLNSNASFPSVATVIYMTFLTTFPFLMLVLFVGRTPTLLWSKRTD